MLGTGISRQTRLTSTDLASCRKRKARCTPSANDDDRCTNCVRHGRPCLAIAASAAAMSPGHAPDDTSRGTPLRPLSGRHDGQHAIADRSVESTYRSRPRRRRDRRSSASGLHSIPPPVMDMPVATGAMVPHHESATLLDSLGMDITLQLGRDPEQSGFLQPPPFQFNGSNVFNPSFTPTDESGPHNICQYDTMNTNVVADWIESDTIFDINNLVEPIINFPPYQATDINWECDTRQTRGDFSALDSLGCREFNNSYPHQLCPDLRQG